MKIVRKLKDYKKASHEKCSRLGFWVFWGLDSQEIGTEETCFVVVVVSLAL
jgi:hypothetical protein